MSVISWSWVSWGWVSWSWVSWSWVWSLVSVLLDNSVKTISVVGVFDYAFGAIRFDQTVLSLKTILMDLLAK